MKALSYVDVHCHLIPGVDDGSESMKESLAALKEEYDQNVKHVICTPHVTADITLKEAANIRNVFYDLKRQVAQTAYGEYLELHLGCEIMYSESIAECLTNGTVWTMAESSYVLVEFLPSVTFEDLSYAVRRLTSVGVLPVLAHIERYECLYKQISRIRSIQDMGAYCQVNATSLHGSIFDQRTAFVKKICKEGLVHFLGTDSHGIIKRKPEMDRGADWVRRHCDISLADRILCENGLDLLNDIVI